MSTKTHFHDDHRADPDHLLNMIGYTISVAFLVYFCYWAVGAMRL